MNPRRQRGNPGRSAALVALLSVGLLAAAQDMATIQVSVTLDASPPQGTVIINGGAARVNHPGVILSLDASDPVSLVAGMSLSNDGVAWNPWEPFQPTRAWTLATGADGPRTVHVRYRDPEGNISLGDIADSILLDQTAPNVISLSVLPPSAMEGETVSLSFSMSEALADPPEVTVNGHPAVYETGGGVYVYTYTIMNAVQDPPGHAYIEISGVDLAGNFGAWGSDSALTITGGEAPLSLPVLPAAVALLGAAFWRFDALRRRRR